jgi:hypothetical protein
VRTKASVDGTGNEKNDEDILHEKVDAFRFKHCLLKKENCFLKKENRRKKFLRSSNCSPATVHHPTSTAWGGATFG